MMVDKLLIGITPEGLDILGYLLVPGNLLFLTSTGVILGFLIISLIFIVSGVLREREDYILFSRELWNNRLLHPFSYILFCLVPLGFNYWILLQVYNSSFRVLQNFMLCGFALFLIALFPIFACRTFFKRSSTLLLPVLGVLASLILIVGGLHVYSACNSILMDTEKWIYTRSLKDILLSWNSFTRLLFILCLLLSIACAYILINAHKGQYSGAFVRTFAGVSLIATIIPQPLLLLWNYLFIPYRSVSLGIILLTGVLFFILFLLAFIVLKEIESGARTGSRFIIVSLLIVIAILTLIDLSGRKNAIAGENLKLIGGLDKLEPAPLLQAEKSKGEEVFNRVCSACHSFESKKVGPAFNAVVPKYKTPEELKAFVKNPVKIDPEFPPMPSPPISDEEIDAVADFLFKRVKEK